MTLLVFLNDKKKENIVTKDAIEKYSTLDTFFTLHDLFALMLRNKLSGSLGLLKDFSCGTKDYSHRP